MPLPRPLLDHTVAALTAVLEFKHPADAVVSRYLRAHPILGQQDRAFVADTVFAVLRRLRLLETLAAGRDPRSLVLAALIRLRGLSLRELDTALKTRERGWLADLKARAEDNSLAVRCDFPDWLLAKLQRQYGEEELLALAQSLQQSAPLDLRVNLHKAEREAVLSRLAAEGIAARATPYSPVGVRLEGKPQINRHPLFLAGAIEIQDEGSQLLCQLLAPRRGEMVADFCAGAGGKTLALGAMMRGSGRLYAFDISEKRLAVLKPRLARSGLSNVHPQWIASENDARLKRLAGKLDRVLVDAPCTGLGTLRRNPDLKWRQDEETLSARRATQQVILAAAAKLVKPGGLMLYATCSLLDEENAQVVESFLATHAQFELRPANAALAQQRIALDTGETLRLAPHLHGTDGFFGALLAKKAA
ncbi:MAG: RsmB/NOP family class I SAM-dependent RNA methyltransferase [Betaproteobacteria bacterium]|nr:MAG: RsmB/NOP family class I SAM-dependent RNA methyltransferase [Betaproteobacteria bacterium]